MKEDITFVNSHPSHAMRIVVLDFETTGFSPALGHRVIEIGAVEVVDGKISRSYQTLVNPSVQLSVRITKLTSITDEMLQPAPSAEVAIPRFLEFVGDAILVAHNISFEMRFLKSECERLDILRDFKSQCTLQMARRLFPALRSHKLGVLLKHLGIEPEGPLHRALPDANATARALLLMQACEAPR